MQTSGIDSSAKHVDTALAVLLAIGIHRRFGYTSTRDDSAAKPSNYRRLYHELNSLTQEDVDSGSFLLQCQQFIEDRDCLTQALAMHTTHDASMTSYFLNVQQILMRPVVNLTDLRTIATIASMPEAFSKINHSTPSSGFFGEVKQRGPLKLRLQTAPVSDTSREFPVVKYRFTDTHGNAFAWNASMASAPQGLVVGQWYEMTATIESHYQSPNNRVQLTYLSRCSDISQTTADSPAPDFYQTATKRQIPDQIELSFSMKNERGIIDGGVYLTLSRRWFESGETRHVNPLVFPVLDWNTNPELLPVLFQQIFSSAGLERSKDVVARIDRKVAVRLQELVKPLYDVHTRTTERLFLVDNAFSPLSVPQTRHTISSSRKSRRLFFSYAEAESHALKDGRGVCVVTELSVEGMSSIPYPSEFQIQDGFEQFMQCIESSGLDAAVSVKSDGRIGKMYPIVRPGRPWSLLNIATVIQQQFKHAPLNTLEASTLGRFSFITITGLDPFVLLSSAPESAPGDELSASTRLAQLLSALHPRITALPYPHLVASADDVLDAISSDTIENQKGFTQIVVTDWVGDQCLRLLGASVIRLHLSTTPYPADASQDGIVNIPMSADKDALLNTLKKASEDAFLKLQ